MTAEPQWINACDLDARSFEVLRGEVPLYARLTEVLRFHSQRNPPVTPDLTVAQDEFSHDVVIPWRDGLRLVYETT